MNKKILLIVSASFLSWFISDASITSIPSWSYSGGLYCYAPVLTTDSGTGAQSVGVDGTQSSFGEMGLTILTDTTTDPVLTVNDSIDNESSFDWTEYIVNVAMNQAFSINSAGVVAPSGWTANITQPSGPVSGVYTGTIDYRGGTPVGIYPGPNSSLDYGYQVEFSGATQYSLTEIVNPVPEPGAFNLLMAGGLLIGGWTVAKCRHAKLRSFA
ncbi:MAG: hypothetical protein ABR955_10510 [Verrucomicrobiota bacterium]|jgi:hypothetical protein